MRPDVVGGRGHQLGVVFLAALPGLFLTRRLRGLGVLLAVAGVYFIVWYCLRQNVRFLLPIVALMAIAGVPIALPTQILPSFLLAVGVGGAVSPGAVPSDAVSPGAVPSDAVPSDAVFSAVMASAGTSISRRTRGEPNSYNLVHCGQKSISITPRSFVKGKFYNRRTHYYKRQQHTWLPENQAPNSD